MTPRDLSGRCFGRLRVIRREGTKRFPSGVTLSLWRCLCDPALGGCGTECLKTSSALLRGSTRSCGCLRRELMRANIYERLAEGRIGFRRIEPDPALLAEVLRRYCAGEINSGEASAELGFSRETFFRRLREAGLHQERRPSHGKTKL